jgi:O-antigen/teichoic acid export membrane protein
MKEPDQTATVADASPETSPKISASPPGQGVRVLQNSVVVLLSRGLGLVMAAAASFILARYLGPERMGEYGAIYAYLTLFVWVASFGLSSILTREAAQNRDQAGSIIYTGIWISAGFAAVTVLAALVLAPILHLGGQLYPLVAIASIEILLLVPFGLPSVIFVVDMKQWFSSAFSIIRQTLMFLIVVGLYRAGASLLYVVLGRLTVAAIETALNWYVGRRFLAPPRNFHAPVARQLIGQGFTMALCIFTINIYTRVDQVMLHVMSSDRILGQYVVAARVSELFEALPAAFIASLFPLLCVSVLDPARFQRHLDLGYRYMMIAAAGICVVCCVGARPIMRLAYGPKYDASGPLLAILIWSEIAIFYGSVVLNALLAAKLQQYALWATVAGAVANLGLNLYLIPHWDATGAAWATVVSYWAGWILALLPFRATRHILAVGLRSLVPVTAIALTVSACAFLLRMNAWGRTGIAVVTYSGLILLCGFVRREDFISLGLGWNKFIAWKNNRGSAA